MTRRGTPRTIAAALILAAAISVSGCTSPTPAPIPTPTGFTDEDAAFAAAEDTYRAYVDALNRVDLSDPATFEDVYRWTTGDAYAGERESLSTMHAEGWTVSGTTIVEEFIGIAQQDDGATVHAVVCSDVSNVSVTDPSGASQVASDRPDQFELDVLFEAANDSPTGLAISSSHAVERSRCA